MIWAVGWRPRMLIPRVLWTAAGEDERMTLVVHELAHLKRRDHWVRWLELLVAGVYWWNPVVWWVCSRMREAEEQCCDAWVVWAMPQRARSYAAALLHVLDFVSGVASAPVVASAMGAGRHVSCLKWRLKMIVSAKTPKGLSWLGRLTVLGSAALLLPLSPTWAQPGRDAELPGRADRVPASETDHPQATVPARPALVFAQPMQDDAAQDKDRQTAEQFANRVKELVDKLAEHVGPVTDEVRKALESAIGDMQKSLEKGDLTADELRQSLEKSHEDMRRAFEQGGPVDKEVREASGAVTRGVARGVGTHTGGLAQSAPRPSRNREKARARDPRGTRSRT